MHPACAEAELLAGQRQACADITKLMNLLRWNVRNRRRLLEVLRCPGGWFNGAAAPPVGRLTQHNNEAIGKRPSFGRR